MPSGTLAPAPLIPVGIYYKAAGQYCRFDGEDSMIMVWGNILHREGEGDYHPCADHCDGKVLRIFYRDQGKDESQSQVLDLESDFRFVVDLEDPHQFGLRLFWPGKPLDGSFVGVGELQPYLVEGVEAACPDRMLMKSTVGRPGMPIKPPLEMKKVTP
jgi:hypothetical protein